MPRASGSKGTGVMLLVLVAAMAALLVHGLYATLAGPRPEPAKPAAVHHAAPARAETAAREAPAPAPKAPPAAASTEEGSGPRFTRGTM